MHKNSQAAAATSQDQAQSAAAFNRMNNLTNNYERRISQLEGKYSTMDPTLKKQLTTEGAYDVSGVNQGTREDLNNLALRTGENSAAYAPAIADAKLKAERSVGQMLNDDYMKDYAARQASLMQLAGMRGSPISSFGGTTTGTAGAGASAAHGIYQPSPWLGLVEDIAGNATKAGTAAMG